MGADDLIENGKDVAVIDYHSGDTYQTTSSISRLQYYGLQGTPTAWFDGGLAVVGGNHTESMYGNYLPKYTLRKSIDSDFTISVEGSNSGLIDYEFTVEIENVGGGETTNLVLHVVVTESNILESWQGMSELNHTERLMAPNQYGTSLDFSAGDLVEETVSFSMDPSWVNENCEVVFFVQNTQTKVVQQAITTLISEFPTNNVNDAALKNIVAPQAVCENTIIPIVTIANYGLDNLTSVDVVYDVNGETPSTYNWTGDLATYESESFELDPVTFEMQEQNEVNVYCVNPNGQEDEFPGNNDKVYMMGEAANATSPVSLALKLDDNPGESTWELWSSAGELLYSGGPYTTPGEFVIEQFQLDDIDCYTFKMFDEGGDGLTGTGSYKLAHNGSEVFAEGKDFEHEDQVQFGIGMTDVSVNTLFSGVEVFPNPIEGTATVRLNVLEENVVNISIYNVMGKKVLHSEFGGLASGYHQLQIDSRTLETGVYFMQVEMADESQTLKVIVR